MAASNSVFCGVCDAKQVTKYADHYCPECEEGLCSECQQHHSLSRATRNHEIISVENYKKLPSFIKSISDCYDHEMRLTNYCPFHDQVCCARCLTSTHKECTNIRGLAELTTNAKQSSLAFHNEEKLKEMLTFLNQIMTDRKQNFSSFRIQRSHFRDEIKSIRFKINTHFDKLEENILTELENAEKEAKTQIEFITKQLDDRKTQVEDFARGLAAVIEYGSDLQVFLGNKKMQDKIVAEEKFLESISGDGSLNNIRLDVSLNGKVKDILSEIKTFGLVTVEADPPLYTYNKKNDLQTDITTVTKELSPMSMEDIKLSLLSTIDIPEGEMDTSMRGCSVCQNGKIIFSDYMNDRLIIMNQEITVEDLPDVTSVDKNTVEDLRDVTSVDKEITVEGPRDVTFVDENTVAVSIDNGINIIDIISSQTKQTIKTEYDPYGITFYKGSLFWCEESKGIQSKLLPDGEICTLVQQEDLPTHSYITAYNDKIYQTNYKTKTVTCFAASCEKKWEFKDDLLLQDPTCVTVDNRGFVYVTSAKSNDIVVISSDGKHGRTLLDEENGMDAPYGIYYDIGKRSLLITFKRGPAFLCHIF